MEPICQKTLNILFGDLQIGEKLTFRQIPCVSCGRMVRVQVQRTPAGYGILKGVLYEPDGPQVHIQCSACRRKSDVRKKMHREKSWPKRSLPYAPADACRQEYRRASTGR